MHLMIRHSSFAIWLLYDKFKFRCFLCVCVCMYVCMYVCAMCVYAVCYMPYMGCALYGFYIRPIYGFYIRFLYTPYIRLPYTAYMRRPIYGFYHRVSHIRSAAAVWTRLAVCPKGSRLSRMVEIKTAPNHRLSCYFLHFQKPVQPQHRQKNLQEQPHVRRSLCKDP